MVALLDYIDGLPSTSRLNEARVNDIEEARRLVQAQLEQPEEEKEEWSPRIADYGLTEMLLREILTQLGGVQQAVVASGGGKPKPIKPFPVPKTALDKARAELEHEFAVTIVGMFGFSESDL